MHVALKHLQLPGHTDPYWPFVCSDTAWRWLWQVMGSGQSHGLTVFRGHVGGRQPRGGSFGVPLRRRASRSVCPAQSPPIGALHCTRHVSRCDPWQRVPHTGGADQQHYKKGDVSLVLTPLNVDAFVLQLSCVQHWTPCRALPSSPWPAVLLDPPGDTMNWCHIRLNNNTHKYR